MRERFPPTSGINWSLLLSRIVKSTGLATGATLTDGRAGGMGGHGVCRGPRVRGAIIWLLMILAGKQSFSTQGGGLGDRRVIAGSTRRSVDSWYSSQASGAVNGASVVSGNEALAVPFGATGGLERQDARTCSMGYRGVWGW